MGPETRFFPADREMRGAMAELEEKRVRLAVVERELWGLGIRHDLAMSAFKFDEAREVQQQIAVLERNGANSSTHCPRPRCPRRGWFGAVP